MSTFVHKESRGTLFKNDYKNAEKHPDIKGGAGIGADCPKCKEHFVAQYDVAAWKDEGEKLSLKITPKRQKDQPKDDLPFNDDLPPNF